MIGDHHGRTAGRATLLVRAMDGILGTHKFRAVDDLAAKVIAFINDNNKRAKPFRWTYDGRPLQAA
jgi:hypothetical protein